MTARQEVETIIGYITKFNRNMDSYLEERIVYPIYFGEMNAFAKMGFIENMNSGDRNMPECWSMNFKNVPIFYENDFARCYSNLPATPLQLPYNKGIDFVSSMRNRDNAYIICDRNQVPNRSEDPNALQGVVWCWKEGTRLYYSKIFNRDDNTTVFMRLFVSDFKTVLDMDAELPIDGAVAQKIRNNVIAYFMPEDNRNQDLNKDAADES